MDYLNDIEKEEIQKFLQNTTLKEAVKKVILASIYFNGTLRAGEKATPTRNFALASLVSALSEGKQISNETLGEDIRGCAMAIYLLEDGYRNLESLKKVEDKPEAVVNPAL